jgi:hypothetical protein
LVKLPPDKRDKLVLTIFRELPATFVTGFNRLNNYGLSLRKGVVTNTDARPVLNVKD